MEPRSSGRPPALELSGIVKSFGPVRALRGASLSAERGAVTGIVGENGAGKSTIMNVAYGLLRPDAGRILVDGRPTSIGGPHDAIAHGIGMVNQHFMLVDTFTVLENLVLGGEAEGGLPRALVRAREELERIGRHDGLRLPPDALAGRLSVGDQQRLEIVKALFRGARILILDEPTAVLTPAETEQLFRLLRGLAAEGTAIVLITHKLREIMALADHVVVMRAGEVVAERRIAETDPGELAELMIGRKLRLDLVRSRRVPGEPVLAAEALGVDDDQGVVRAEDISFEIRSGEVVGIAGVSGNGQSELLEVLAGMRRPSRGTIRVCGREVTADRPTDARAMRRLGVAHVPEHRHRHGLVAEFDAAETAMLGREGSPRYGRALLDRGRIRDACRTLMARADVRPAEPSLRVAGFSGGNQQKLVLGREVEDDPAILLVGQPTRGVDIGAVAAIHVELTRLRESGCAILLVSAEMEEILAVCDRILVMVGGRIVGELAAAEADEATLGRLMGGLAPAEDIAGRTPP